MLRQLVLDPCSVSPACAVRSTCSHHVAAAAVGTSGFEPENLLGVIQALCQLSYAPRTSYATSGRVGSPLCPRRNLATAGWLPPLFPPLNQGELPCGDFRSSEEAISPQARCRLSSLARGVTPAGAIQSTHRQLAHLDLNQEPTPCKGAALR